MDRGHRPTPLRITTALLGALVLSAPALADEERELGGMDVIGNRELPKGLYILPWQRSQIAGEIPRPDSSLTGDALGPLDPDVFRRELEYHQALQQEQ